MCRWISLLYTQLKHVEQSKHGKRNHRKSHFWCLSSTSSITHMLAFQKPYIFYFFPTWWKELCFGFKCQFCSWVNIELLVCFGSKFVEKKKPGYICCKCFLGLSLHSLKKVNVKNVLVDKWPGMQGSDVSCKACQGVTNKQEVIII